MTLTLKNIANIKNTIIDLDGVTLISGLNDTGKSTVGKVIVLLNDAINNYHEYRDMFLKEVGNDITSSLAKLQFLSRRMRHMTNKEEFHNIELEVKKLIDTIGSKLKYTLHDWENNTTDISKLFIDEKKHISKSIEELKQNKEKSNRHRDSISMLSRFLQDVKKEIQSIEENFEHANKISKREYVKFLIKNIFDNDMISHGASESSIELKENDNLILKIEINLQNEPSLEIQEGNYEYATFKSAVYIETPLLLEYRQFMNSKNKYINKAVLEALREVNDKRLLKKDLKNVENYLQEILRGSFEKKDVSLFEEEISFKRKGHSYVLKNVATGLKSFGMIDILVKNNALDKNTCLIIDEPEVHLHPNWKTVYTELLAILAEAGVKILLTTHDPFVVKGIEYYTKNRNLNLNAYLAENNGFTDISNNFEDLDAIFSNLSEPMVGEVWDDTGIVKDEEDD